MKREFLNIPGHVHFLTFSCLRKQRLLSDEQICLWLAEAIDEARHAEEFDLWANVFMPEGLLKKPNARLPAKLRIFKPCVGAYGCTPISLSVLHLRGRTAVRPYGKRHLCRGTPSDHVSVNGFFNKPQGQGHKRGMSI